MKTFAITASALLLASALVGSAFAEGTGNGASTGTSAGATGSSSAGTNGSGSTGSVSTDSKGAGSTTDTTIDPKTMNPVPSAQSDTDSSGQVIVKH